MLFPLYRKSTWPVSRLVARPRAHQIPRRTCIAGDPHKMDALGIATVADAIFALEPKYDRLGDFVSLRQDSIQAAGNCLLEPCRRDGRLTRSNAGAIVGQTAPLSGYVVLKNNPRVLHLFVEQGGGVETDLTICEFTHLVECRRSSYVSVLPAKNRILCNLGRCNGCDVESAEAESHVEPFLGLCGHSEPRVDPATVPGTNGAPPPTARVTGPETWG